MRLRDQEERKTTTSLWDAGWQIEVIDTTYQSEGAGVLTFREYEITCQPEQITEENIIALSKLIAKARKT